MLGALERRLILPGCFSQGRPEARPDFPDDVKLISTRTSSGHAIVLAHAAAKSAMGEPLPDAPARPTLLFFYGNAMCLSQCDWELECFRRLGVNVCIPELVGYGLSSGRASESACYATAGAAYSVLTGQLGVAPQQMVVAGWSLGAAIAIDLAWRSPVAGLIACCAFTSIREVARHVLPRWLPLAFLMRGRFENQRKLPEVRCPVLLVHGEADNLIPSAMGQRLSRLLSPGQVRFLTITGAGHNDLFLVGGVALLQAFQEFVSQCTRLSPT